MLRLLQNILYFIMVGNFLGIINIGQILSSRLLLLCAGDVELNPGPISRNLFSFFHWNLNSICARENVQIPLIEAYNSVHRFDVLAISESMLDSSISNNDISSEGFSKEIFRNDHPSNTKTGGVCLYYREGLSIKHRKDLEILQETVVAEIHIARKKILFCSIYRSLSQNSVDFEVFIQRLQTMLNRMRTENVQSIIVTGDLNCRSSQWWPRDVENAEGASLDELIESNNLVQLIDEPTNIRGEGMSCIDLIITNQPNMFVESGVHPSLDEHCQHQVIYGKLNMSVPYPPPYKRTVWDYENADIPQIRDCLQGVNWELNFGNQGSEEMTNTLTKKIYEIMSKCIPNCVIKCDEKDPPWITQELKTAIKRKHRVFRHYVNRGRRPEDWAKVKDVRNSTSKMITDAKQKYHITLGRK